MKHKNNSVDLLIPFHKVDRFLFKAIRSASKSKGVILRIILLDDRELLQDKDQLILEEIFTLLNDQKLDFILHRTSSRGYANALNESKQLVKSDFVAILNSDDLMSRKRLLVQTNELKTGFDVSICRLKKFTLFFPLPALLGSVKFEYCTEMLLVGAYGADATFVTTKKLWQLDFHYNTQITMADWEMALRCYPKYRVSLITEPLYYYRMHKSQLSRKSTEKFLVPNEFYLAWIKHSVRVGLPETNREQVSILATPWNAPRHLSEIQRTQILEWLDKYHDLLVSQGINGDFVGRRLVFLRLQGYKNHFSIQVATKMIFEFLWLRLLNQGPRINLKVLNWLRSE